MGKYIILVEDSEAHRFLVKHTLERAGHQVRALASGHDIDKVLAEKQPDLIVVDLLLPQPDGLAITRQIRQHAEYSEIPIVAMTASAYGDVEEACFKAGIVGIINKPIAGNELINQIELYLE